MDVADREGKLRDFIIQMALTRQRCRFKSTGKINPAAIARELKVHRSTISRILSGKRHLVHPEDPSLPYHPSPKLLGELMRVHGSKDLEDLWGDILNADPPPPDVI